MRLNRQKLVFASGKTIRLSMSILEPLLDKFDDQIEIVFKRFSAPTGLWPVGAWLTHRPRLGHYAFVFCVAR